jgi:serine protease Do
MQHSILLSAILLPLFSVCTYCTQCPAVERAAGPYSFSLATDAGFGADEESTGAYLGVDISDVTSDRLTALKLKDERGVEVTMVDQDAPAGKAGLKEHDVILTMNGTSIESGAQLRRMIRETPPGRTVTFGVSRDGQPQTIKVQLADRHKTVAWGPKIKDFKFDMPDMPNMSDFDFPVSVTVVHSGMRSGLMIENITPQLGDFFGVKDGKGVLIRSVEKGSHAERAGFRAGDVIVRVNNQPVHDTSDFSHALRSHGKGTVTVGIVRERKEQTLTLPLPERKDTGDYLEESIDSSDLNAQVERELTSRRQQIAQLEPQLQYAIQESRQALERVRPEIERAQRAAREEIERERPQIERAIREAEREAQSANQRFQHEMCAQQRAMHEQAHKMQQHWQKQHQEIMKQNHKMMEKLRHEMKGDWIQI